MSDAPEPADSNTTSSKETRAEEVIRVMRELYPDAHCALDYDSALELLVATILSAQSTDERVNIVTEDLFEAYTSAEEFAHANPEELQEMIRSTGFFRNKAKYIMNSAEKIVEEHGGEVPDTMEELTELPGVARKTANVVLGTYFEKPVGFVVDTHIKRVTYRLGLTDETRPEKVEQDLMQVFPREEWIFLGHAIIWHGRQICSARKPACLDDPEACPLADRCDQVGVYPSTGEVVDPAEE
jgi:endonuclease-3